jgi:hypothetical protein
MNTACQLREVYTVHVNSRNVASPSSNVNFTAQIDIPLRNVVKAELVMASISTSANTYPVLHVHVDELVNKFVTVAGVSTTIAVSSTQTTIGSSNGVSSNVGFLKNSFAVLPMDPATARAVNGGRVVYTKLGSFNTESSYINPIRQLTRLTITVWNPDGTAPVTTAANGESYFTFRFECAKDNICLY